MQCRVWVYSSPKAGTPYGRCYMSVLVMVDAVDVEDMKDAVLSLNSSLVFPVVWVTLTSCLAPTALASLVLLRLLR